jgi:hypothetical protein
VPATQEPAAPAAAAAPAEVPAAAPSGNDAASRPRPAAKKNGKGRRASVPSWDEIMLGSSRPRE